MGTDGSFQQSMFAVLTGLALAAAFPEPAAWPLAWIALVPLLVVLKKTSMKRAAGLGLLTGFVFFGALLYWVNLFGTLPWFLLSLFQALYIAVFAVLYRRLNKARPWVRLAVVPAIWTTCEWLRSLGYFGFTWGDLAISQYKNLPFLQLASVTGTWGLSYIIVLVNISLADVGEQWKSKSFRSALGQLAVATAVAAIAHLSGYVRLDNITPGSHGEGLRIALVQGSFNQDQPVNEAYARRVMRVYSGLTRECARRYPDVVVWPETVIPGDLLSDFQMRKRLGDLAKEMRADLLVGGSAYKNSRLYNGAFLFNRDGDYVGEYYKVHLVPFGETVPLRKYLPLLERYRVRDENYHPGPGFHPVGRYGVMICFESIFPNIAREMVRRNARLLVVMTNDAWFKRTAAPEQHMAFSVFRAVETGHWLVRCASTGISCVIDPRGRQYGRLGLWRRGVVLATAGTGHTTFYRDNGDWFAVICAVVSGAYMACAAGWAALGNLGSGSR